MARKKSPKESAAPVMRKARMARFRLLNRSAADPITGWKVTGDAGVILLDETLTPPLPPGQSKSSAPLPPLPVVNGIQVSVWFQNQPIPHVGSSPVPPGGVLASLDVEAGLPPALILHVS
ncbi:MAG: hypothetical protein MUE73_12085 [Planctomycetes bacterium]|jgi:hypothetical protein|nr:hypothetical protein [Planctomycetota bacterium]